jgi:hypothetical protein
MQSANGLVVFDNVVIQLFGGQSRAQTIKLAPDIARLVATAKSTTTTTLPGPGTPAKGPMIGVTTTQHNVANGFMPLTLKCTRAKCVGVVKLIEATSFGKLCW